MMGNERRSSIVPTDVAIALLVAAATQVAQGQSITVIATNANVGGISRDGETVFGSIDVGAGARQPYRWTAAAGLQLLTGLGGPANSINDCSATAATAVGSSNVLLVGDRPVIWGAGGEPLDLGVLPVHQQSPGAFGMATGVSGDGLIVSGWSTPESSVLARAFRWTASEGMINLGILPSEPNNQWSYAYGLSADGSTIVGASSVLLGHTHAFRWTQALGMQDLGVLPGAIFSEASSASLDGSVIVGRCSYPVPGGCCRVMSAFRWAPEIGMRDLGSLSSGPDAFALASDVSDDGQVVVGASGRWGVTSSAFLWHPAQGMVALRTHLIQRGVDLAGWTEFFDYPKISGNGRFIAGAGLYNGATTAFVADIGELPPPPPVCGVADFFRDYNVNGADLGILLSQWGPSTAVTVADLNDDGMVDGADLGVFLSLWGPCP
jgi:probable HAF family extracellular repeat protein